MSAIEMAKQNAIARQKAAELDSMKERERSQQIYDSGLMDAYSAVEREMMRKAQEQVVNRQMQQAAQQYNARGANDYNPTLGQAVQDAGNWIGKKFDGLANSFAGTPAADPYAAEAEALRKDVEAEAARKVMMGQQ